MKIKKVNAYTLICIIAIVVLAIIIIVQFCVLRGLTNKKNDLKDKNDYIDGILDKDEPESTELSLVNNLYLKQIS